MRNTLGNMASMAMLAVGAMIINCYVGLVAIVAGQVGTVAFFVQLFTSFNPTPAEVASTLIRIMLNSLFPAMLIFALGSGSFFTQVIPISGILIILGIIGIFWFKEEK